MNPSTFASLRDALRAAYEESAIFVKRKRSLPTNDRLLWVNTNGTQVRLETVAIPSLGSLSPRARDQLFNGKAWRSHDKIFMQDSRTATLVTDGFSVFGWKQRLDLNNFKHNILDELFMRTLGAHYSPNEFEDIWADLECFFVDASITMRVVAPVQNLKLEVPIALGHAAFRALPPIQAARIEMPFTWEARGSIVTPSRWAFVTELEFKRTTEVVPTWGADRQARDCVEALQAVLHQVSASQTAIPSFAFEFSRWTPLGGNGAGCGDGRAPPASPALLLKEAAAVRVLSLWVEEHQKLADARGVPPLIPTLERLPDPTVAYVAVYRAHFESVEPVLIPFESTTVSFVPGPIEVSFGAIQGGRMGSASTGIMATVRRRFPAEGGPYVVLRTSFLVSGPEDHGRVGAMQSVAEARAILELMHPGLVGEYVYEGVDDGHVFSPEGPLRIVASRPTDLERERAAIASAFGRVGQLGNRDDADTERSRFRLAARWYSRGLSAASDVDRLFYFWTCLEVHPTRGTVNVEISVARYLKEKMGLTLSEREIKTRLCFTGKAGLINIRGQLIHRGTSTLLHEEPELANYNLRCLECIAATCLRLLAGLDAGDDLRPYLADD